MTLNAKISYKEDEMKEELFIMLPENLQDIMEDIELQDCGMSWKYKGWHWFSDDCIDVYYKED